MRSYTVHLRRQHLPVLTREGFSFAALIFGPIWLFAHRAWIPGLIVAALWVLALAAAPPGPVRPVSCLALAIGTGLFGTDLLRWSLGLRGYVLSGVAIGRNLDDALSRLFDRRPDLAESAASLETLR